MGLVMLAAAGVSFRNPLLGARLYAALLLVATIWSVFEVGFDIWGLEVRLFTLVGIAAWMLLPWVWRTGQTWVSDKRELLGSAVIAMIAIIASCFTSYSINGTLPADRMAATNQSDLTAKDTPDADWPAYGRTVGGDRYSPLAQITPANVSNLKRAWVTRTGDVQKADEGVVAGPDQGHEFNLEVTPIKVDDTLYLCTPHNWVMALDAKTGKVKWKFDPKPAAEDLAANVYLACRGVSYYKAPDDYTAPRPARSAFSPRSVTSACWLSMLKPASPAKISASTASFPCASISAMCRMASTS